MNSGSIKTFRIVIQDLVNNYIHNGYNEFINDSGWCLYSDTSDIDLDSNCIIDRYPDIDDNTYEESDPESIVALGFEFIFRDEILQDVIVSVYEQDESSTIETYYNAIIYYDENDTFLQV